VVSLVIDVDQHDLTLRIAFGKVLGNKVLGNVDGGRGLIGPLFGLAAEQISGLGVWIFLRSLSGIGRRSSM